MNICTPGNCICDAAEWPGDTDCMGEVRGEVEPSLDLATWNPRYYFNRALGVVFSVQREEMRTGVQYYFDPDLTSPVPAG